MTDLQQTILMFSKSRELFEKAKNNKDWKLIVTERGITFYFDENENFKFITKL